MNLAMISEPGQEENSISNFAIAEAFYRREIGCLQSDDFEGWLALLNPQIEYEVFTLVSTKPGDSTGSTPGKAYYYDDNYDSLSLRTRKLRSSMAWTESPRSYRRYFSQLLDCRAGEDELEVRSNVLVLTTRSDNQESRFCGERYDRLSIDGGTVKLRSRSVQLDRTIVVDRFLNTFF